MERRKFLAVAGAGAVTGIAGCSGETDYEEGNSGGSESSDESSSDSSNSADGGSEQEAELEILEHELVIEDEGSQFASAAIEGRAENVGDSQLGYAEVRARFYNSQGDQMETGLANTNDLDAGQTWAFEIMFLGNGEDVAEIDDYDIGVGSNF